MLLQASHTIHSGSLISLYSWIFLLFNELQLVIYHLSLRDRTAAYRDTCNIDI